MSTVVLEFFHGNVAGFLFQKTALRRVLCIAHKWLVLRPKSYTVGLFRGASSKHPVMSAPSQPLASAQKRVLIVATTHWISTARLVMALDALGCRVELMAPVGHPALKTGAVAAQYDYWPLLPLSALRRAIRKGSPDLVLLGDELSFLLVEELAHWASVTNTWEASAVTRILQHSFGSVECLPLTRSRMAVLSAAESAGVPIPLTSPLRSRRDVDRVVEEMPGPWMLKADATWGGFGVRSAAHRSTLAPTWRSLQRPFGLGRSLKRGWQGNEWAHLRIWLRREKRDVIAQQFVRGRERTGMAVCARGELKAAVCLEVEAVRYDTGPSSLLRVVDDEAMVSNMRRIASRLGITGFCGFDFMIEARTGKPHLLEMNMRPTQLAHLPLGAGRDLCAALVRDVLGAKDVKDRSPATDSPLIALFPQELLRDPDGLRLGEAFHDVPWAAPRLIEEAMYPHRMPSLLRADPRWRADTRVREGAVARPALWERQA